MESFHNSALAPSSAKPRLEKADVGERCQIVSGSFFETIPTADGYLLKNIIHDWDDAASTSILRRCRDAIADGGRLLIDQKITHQELSEMVGTTRSRVGFFLKRFRDSGLVEENHGSTLVIHEWRLAAYVLAWS